MNRRILVPGESNKTHFALLLCCQQGFRRAVHRKDQVRIVVINHFMNLPKIQVIGLQPPQRFLQLLHRHILGSPMRAHFRHQECLIPLAL